MNDFYDFNKNGKLDGLERATKINNELGLLDKDKPRSGSGAYSNYSGGRRSGGSDYHRDSPSENFFAAFGAGAIAAGAGFLGYLTLGIKDLGILILIVAFVFAILTLVYFARGVAAL